MKSYIVKRTVIEEFCVDAKSRKEAKEKMMRDEHGCPNSITFVKETFKVQKLDRSKY